MTKGIDTIRDKVSQDTDYVYSLFIEGKLYTSTELYKLMKEHNLNVYRKQLYAHLILLKYRMMIYSERRKGVTYYWTK